MTHFHILYPFLRLQRWLIIAAGLMLNSAATLAQAALYDDFSDGDFTNNPPWLGDVSKFEVNNALQLHLNAPAVSDTAVLVTAATAALAAEWRFLFILDFAPSSSNYLKVYLMADQPNLRQPVNGYYLRAGKDGSDDRLQLVRQQGLSETVLIEGTSGAVAGSYNSVRVKVTRTADGTFSLYADYNGGTAFVLEGTSVDNTISSSQYFGFFCKYTSTRSDKFYFDDVYAGPPQVDTVAPSVQQVTIASPQSLYVQFSEPLEANSAQQPAHYWLNEPSNTPTTIVLDDVTKSLVTLSFDVPLVQGVNSLAVFQIADLAGNILVADTVVFVFQPPQPGDILINEIMADPSPPLQLPEAEYIELFNASSVSYDLKGWSFSDRNSSITLSSFLLEPGSYLILCDADVGTQLSAYGPVMTHASFPSLNNGDDLLQLLDPFGVVIDAVEYSDDWYQVTPTPTGGVALERIHPLVACRGPSNWHASLDSSGGTPGKKNSVTSLLVDTVAPQLQEAMFATTQSISLIFSEPVDSLSASLPANYLVEAEDGQPLSVQEVVVAADHRQCALLLFAPADSNRLYRCLAKHMMDCVGNVNMGDTALLALTSLPRIGDVVINEILFNPPTGGSDYVELYNASDKIFDLKKFFIARANEHDSIVSKYQITPLSRLLLPGEYIALSPDPQWVKHTYFTPNPTGILESKLPSYPDDEGIVVVLCDTLQIDRVHYSDDWHFPLLDEAEGVALERISPKGPSQDSMNWHSAAATAGYGTPAYQNSQFIELGHASHITISPKVFSPDHDGFQDVLLIQYDLDKPGYVLNLRILDAEGRMVKHLVNNQLMDQSGFFTWDGTGNDGRTVRMGHYVLLAEFFDLNGQVFRQRTVFSVAYRKR
ncbi:MAG: lamin tail domain-containing protein [Chitinophagales bacterium]|nr:lamin tail domain-containing protein [Chitinophagales bacterium]MDW8427218.1 lamin tail domain-containing protein [Chitinophagales bacterium]